MNAESLRGLEQLARRVESLLTAWGEMEESEKRDAIAADIRSFAALAQAGEGVPPGWVLVPREPTEAMLNAGWVERDCWVAMLAAAPAAQGVGE